MQAVAKQLPLFLFALFIAYSAQVGAQATTATSVAKHFESIPPILKYPQSDPPPNGLTLLNAVASTLAEHPLIRSQQAQLRISRGLQEQAASPFNSVITSGLNNDRANIPLTSSQLQQNLAGGFSDTDQLTYHTTYGVAFQRLFRNGISINPQLQLGRVTDNVFNSGGVNTSTLSFAVNVPLMRGRGRSVVAAQEQAAKAEMDATLLDLNHLIAQLIFNTAFSYWNLVAAEKNLAIAAEAEERGAQYLRNVQQLVDADHVPRNDLHEVTANLAQRASSRLAAEQQVLAAQKQLALDMGMSPQQILEDQAMPADDFPSAEDQDLPLDTPSCMEYYSEQALQRRADYLASRRRYAETSTLLTAARNKLLPQVDLSFSSGYSGLDSGRQLSAFFGAAYQRVPGMSAATGITYTFPPSNQQAHGAVMQSEGAVIQADMQTKQLARAISSSVVVTLEGLRNAVVRARQARQSVESFRAALAGEREKYAGGVGSIVNILTVEDRLTAALADQVQSELAYAQALAQFRFATGTLVQPNQPLQNVPADTFLALPFRCAPQLRP